MTRASWKTILTVAVILGGALPAAAASTAAQAVRQAPALLLLVIS